MDTSGLLINVDWSKSSFAGIQTNNRTHLLDYLHGYKRPFPLTITMPCGEIMVFSGEMDLPESSLQCSCGRLGHWFIKYTD